MKNIFDTKTTSFQELLGNGKKHKVPEFQRDFSWKEEHWEDLWQDLKDIYEDRDAQHYMGTIVLQNTNEKKTFLIVDGQQRMTTLSLFILAIVKNLKDLVEKDVEIENNTERIKKILNTYVGEKSISDLYYKSKLTLNENNDSFYQSRMLEFKEPVNRVKLRDSEKLIYNAYQFFYKQIRDYFINNMSGEILGEFLEKTLDGITFIQITVDDDVSAYTVFETLNARGVELTTTDLLKNYLFAIVAPLGKTGSEFKILKEDWQQIVDIVGLKKFPVFLRFYLNSKQNIVRKERLFKEIKKEVKTPKQALQLIEKLKETAYLYAAISNPNDDYWNDYSGQKEIRYSLSELKLFRVTQPIPLLFAINKHKKEWFSIVLKLLVSISFRYNVIGKLNPNAMEKVYNKLSMKIVKGEINNTTKLKSNFSEIYVDDATFSSTFRSKEIATGRNKALVKYILTKIENQIANKEYGFSDSTFTIEHILPENYDETWNEKFSSEADQFIYRLGNYTLLEEKKTRQISDKPFSEKKKVYATSQFKLSNNELNFDDWNIQSLNAYQNKLARYAKTIWKI